MRKIVLTLIVALLGLVMTTPTADATRILDASDITIPENESVNAKVSINFAGLWDYLDIHIIICSRDALDECNYEDRTKTLRRICFSNANPKPDGCLAYPSSPIEIELFKYTGWAGNPGVLPSGIYEVKVIEYNPETPATRYMAVEVISDSSFVLKYDKEPSLSGQFNLGSTLQLTPAIWSPTPFAIEIAWYRCNQTTASFFIRGNEEVPYEGLGVTCNRLNQDGTLYVIPDDLGGLGSVSESFISFQILVASTTGFTEYEIQPIDIGSSITAIISVFGDFDSRKYGVASTPIITAPTVPEAPVIDPRTKPINQVAPTSTFTKTKKMRKLQVGAKVTATSGTWKWSNATTFQWYICSKKQRSTSTVNKKQCTPIKKASKVTYKIKKADKGRFVVARVTATNEIGSTVLYATSLGKIK